LASLRGAALWIGAAVGYLVLEAVAAASFKPGYSYAHNFISDLGLSSGQLVHGRLVDSSRPYLMHAAFYLQGVPLQIGAPEVAFPRLNALSFWLFVFGALIALSGFIVPGGPAGFGWTA
jgi:hypothetical membrane protein